MTVVQAARHDAIPLDDNTAELFIESPAYWGRRRYGEDPDELGQEPLWLYLERMVAHGREVRRILKPSGAWWCNIGDTAAGSGGAGGDYGEGGKASSSALKYRQAEPLVYSDRIELTLEGPRLELVKIPAGSWCNVPGRLEDALVADGWRVRARVTWDKGRRRPEDLGHVKRPGESSETILFLVPGSRNEYRWRVDQMASRSAARPIARKVREVLDAHFVPGNRDAMAAQIAEELTLDELGDVWHFAPSGKSTRDSDVTHAAPFPDELVRRCLLPTTIPGDLVVDAFAGSGTVGRVAESLGRRAALFDLYASPLPASATPPPILCTRGGAAPTEADLEVVEQVRVTLTDLSELELKPAVFYHATRELSRLMEEGVAEEHAFEAVRICVRPHLTDDQLDYLRRKTA